VRLIMVISFKVKNGARKLEDLALGCFEDDS
jgi:hypothetical protein